MAVIDESGLAVARPPDVQAGVAALNSLSPHDQVDRVTELLVTSNAQLQVCIYAQDLPGITQVKADAELIEKAVKQRKLGREMQDNASEFLRRSERGLGMAIREGQARGEIRKAGQRDAPTGLGVSSSGTEKLKSTKDYLGVSGQAQNETYAMTDDVSDDAFEEAVIEARAEGNLSRANVARKAKARATEVAPGITADELDDLNPPPPVAQVDERSTRILDNLESSLDGMVITLRYLKYDQLDTSRLDEQCNNVSDSLATIRKSIRNIRRSNGI